MPATGSRRGRRPGALALACALALAATVALPVDAGERRSFSAVASETAGKMWSGAQDVTVYALGLIGVKYKFGGNDPESGLDCSGLVRYVFQEVTGVTLPRTSKEMSGLGARVGVTDLMPGDLVFFNTRRFANSHVGIYIGDNRFIHAPSRGGDVEIATFSAGYWQKRFNGARRLVGSLPSLVPPLISPAMASPQPLPGELTFPAASSPLSFATVDVTP